MELIALIEKKLGKKAIIEFQPLQLGDATESFADIQHSVDKLGFKPKITINEGIQILIKWYKEYYVKR